MSSQLDELTVYIHKHNCLKPRLKYGLDMSATVDTLQVLTALKE